MQDMQKQVQTHYSSIKKEGTKKAQKPEETPLLNKKPYHLFVEVAAENAGYLGVKYIMDDF